MFEIDHLDFFGSDRFNEIMEKLFSNADRVERITEDGVPYVRVYAPKRGEHLNRGCDIAKTTPPFRNPSWRKEVRLSEDSREVPPTIEPSQEIETQGKSNDNKSRLPKSILEMLEDGDERIERLLGKIIDKKLTERNIVANNFEGEEDESPKENISVFIANRLTFLIQALQPIVFDTSNIEVASNSLTIAINEKKTFPKISTIDELGFITSQINASSTVIYEIENYLKDTRYCNIYCFPTTMEDRDGRSVFAVKFVVYERK